MDSKDTLDRIIKRHYGKLRDKLIPSGTECPDEDLLWGYTQDKLDDDARGKIERHLISCNECLESLEAIRLIQKAETSGAELPDAAYNKARAVLQKALEGAESGPAKSPVTPAKIVLLWDRARDMIAHAVSGLDQPSLPLGPELRPVRRSSATGKRFDTDETLETDIELKAEKTLEAGKTLETGKALQNFPCEIQRAAGYGKITILVDISPDKEFLSLKIRLESGQIKDPAAITANLYKSGTIYSSVYLDEKGEAFFHKVKEGIYELRLLKEKEPLEILEIPIVSVKQ